MGRRIEAVVFDFYGTLARATRWLSIQDVLAEHGYELSDEANDRWWMGLDGVEHREHSRSPEQYEAWRSENLLAMLSETDVHPGKHALIVEKLHAHSSTRVIEAYTEVDDVLTELRAAGLDLAVCSNWDWDLDEALTDAGLDQRFDVVVSSAWAGARKPHPLVFRYTLEKLDTPAERVLFVGDTWAPDVEGPRAFGMTPAYLVRDGRWPDATAPADLTGIAVIADLRGVLDQL